MCWYEFVYFLLMIFGIWIVMINIVKNEISKELSKEDKCIYRLVVRVLAYNKNKIVGETCARTICEIKDKDHEYEDVVRKYKGSFVKIEYCIMIEGLFILRLNNHIYSVTPLYTLSN